MKFSFKKFFMPKNNETKEVENVQLWYVEWTSRYGCFSSDTRKEMEAFTSEQLANEFAASLKAAFKLTKNTSENSVRIRKN